MSQAPRMAWIVLSVLAAAACGGGPAGDDEAGEPPATDRCDPGAEPYPQDCFFAETWDVEANGLPRFVAEGHVDPARVARVSRFRSGIGHDYADDFESCRSMKHYFVFTGSGWGDVEVVSPIRGTVTSVRDEQWGSKIELRSAEYPAFHVELFHVELAGPLQVLDVVEAGQRLGTHAGDMTMSDVAVGVVTPNDGPGDFWLPGWRYVSFFEVAIGPLLRSWEEHGLAVRSEAIISREERDAAPLRCAENGGPFLDEGSLENWLDIPW